MDLLTSLLLLGSLALTQAQTPGCSRHPGDYDLAINGVASQISDLQLPTMGYAQNAIDGIKDTTYKDGSCTHTTRILSPWWEVDLARSYRVSKVIITNRQDCCSDRLIGAEVRIGNRPNHRNPVCGTVTSVDSATLAFCCEGMVGRYVTVMIPGQVQYLTLCEVEVYGQLF